MFLRWVLWENALKCTEFFPRTREGVDCEPLGARARRCRGSCELGSRELSRHSARKSSSAVQMRHRSPTRSLQAHAQQFLPQEWTAAGAAGAAGQGCQCKVQAWWAQAKGGHPPGEGRGSWCHPESALILKGAIPNERRGPFYSGLLLSETHSDRRVC